jgi:hypothetical protein
MSEIVCAKEKRRRGVKFLQGGLGIFIRACGEEHYHTKIQQKNSITNAEKTKVWK